MTQNASSNRISKDQPSGPRLGALAGVLVVFALSAGM